MTTTTQQLPSNPAIDFANAVLAETDNAREIINMLHDIAQGHRENSTANDRIAASRTLLDRGLGKCPKHISPSAGTDPESAESDNHVNHSSDTRQTVSRNEPDSPRLVTQLDAALNDSLGPAPSAHSTATQPVGASLKPARPTDSAQTPDPFEPLSIHFSIQQHILDITNNCRTLITALTDICRTPDDNPKACPEEEPALSQSKGRRVTDYHRVRAGRMLLDRILGTDPNALRSAVCPGCLQSWTTHTCSPVHPERSPVLSPVEGAAESKDEEEPFDEEVWEEILAELKKKEEAGILHPDPNAPKIDISSYLPPEDFDLTPYLDQADAFWAKNTLRLERQKQWPEIEERRRKKLEQIYPSHSEDEDGEPPET